MTKKFSWLVGLIVLLNASGFACSCRGFGPACTEMVSNDVTAIVLGTVETVSPPIKEEKEPYLQYVEVTVSIQESFKGGVRGKTKVRTPYGESACGFTFKPGLQYLIYASEYQGNLHTSICQRTRPSQFAEVDLEYLRESGQLPNTAEIFGSYKRYTYDPNFVPKFKPSLMDHYRPPEEEYRAMAPMTGEVITLTSASGQTFETHVDADGRFVFKNLALGKYSIKTEAPPKLSAPRGYVSGLMYPLRAIELLPKGCAEVTFRTQPDGRIAGIIVDKEGHPLRNVELRLWKPGLKKFDFANDYDLYDKNNDDGTFELGPVPPGTYILGAYVWTLPQGYPHPDDESRLQDATLRFFSAANDYRRATPITVQFGEHVNGIRLVIPFNPDDWKAVVTYPKDHLK